MYMKFFMSFIVTGNVYWSKHSSPSPCVQ